MSVDDPSELEEAFRRAEDARSRGDWAEAFDGFFELLRERVALSPHGSRQAVWPKSIDLVILERLAGLAILFGYFEPSDALLEAMAMLCERAGNTYAADYTTLKRIHLALDRGSLGRALKLLGEMAPRIGEFGSIQITNSGLDKWEVGGLWLGIDRSGRRVLFAMLYLEIGRLLAGLGRYEDSRTMLSRGLEHAGTGAPELARLVGTHLKLALIVTRMERGDLKEARSDLDRLGESVERLREPSLLLHRRLLSTKVELLQGDYGAALVGFREIFAFCEKRRIPRAALYAALNYAEILITVNQTRNAAQILETAGELALQLKDDVAVARASIWLRLSRARGYSPGGGISIGPTISQRWVRHTSLPRPWRSTTCLRSRVSVRPASSRSSRIEPSDSNGNSPKGDSTRRSKGWARWKRVSEIAIRN